MFELHITSSKDITKLCIDFSDGTCITSEPGIKDEKQISPKEEKVKAAPKKKVTTQENNESFGREDTPLDLSYLNKAPEKSVSEENIGLVSLAGREPMIDDIQNNLKI